jgi:hypothetical protein
MPSLISTDIWNSNSPDGYRCGRYQKAIVTTGRPPTTESLVPDDLARHLNNAGSEQTGSPSPFISTSNLSVYLCVSTLRNGVLTQYF